jgi:hypothetical protein
MFNKTDSLEGMFNKFEKDRVQKIESMQSNKVKLNSPFKRRTSIPKNKERTDCNTYMNVRVPQINFSTTIIMCWFVIMLYVISCSPVLIICLILSYSKPLLEVSRDLARGLNYYYNGIKNLYSEFITFKTRIFSNNKPAEKSNVQYV